MSFALDATNYLTDLPPEVIHLIWGFWVPLHMPSNVYWPKLVVYLKTPMELEIAARSGGTSLKSQS